jgi:hypothetical protein
MNLNIKHPKYYKELRKLRNKLDQAISSPDSREVVDSVRPGPGLSGKPQATSKGKRQATSKRQASK